MSSEKIKAFWQDATAEDVARVMAGEAVEAKFWDDEHWGYVVGPLAGWTKGDPSWMFCNQDHGQSYFEHCQVYREPSWWTNKPDPGPGYRLLEKLPDEPVAVGDEFFQSGKWYTTCRTAGDSQDQTGWYRRRIEAVEPKFAVGRLVRVVGPKGSDAKQWSEEMNKHLGKESAVSNRENKDAGWFYELGCSATWAFREDYIEPVEPDLGKAEAIKQFIAGDTFRHPNGLLLTVTAKGFEVTQ
jgi:hypothetical protein